jgi:Carbonic anhydrase
MDVSTAAVKMGPANLPSMESLFMRQLKFFTLILMLSIASPVWGADASPAGGPTSDQALQRLVEGNQRFVSGKSIHPNQGSARLAETSKGQKPFAVILSCSDSRVPPEVVFDQGVGDLFVIRVAGNTVNEEGLGSIEYAVKVLGAPLIMVLGHSSCGAVDAALQGKPLPGHMATFTTPIDPAIKEGNCKTDSHPLSCAVGANVDHVVKQLRKYEPILAPLVKEGKLKVVGADYDLASGAVNMRPEPKPTASADCQGAEQVVGKFMKLDYDIGRTSSEAYKKHFDELILYKLNGETIHEEPGWDSATIIREYRILGCKQESNLYKVSVEYQSLGVQSHEGDCPGFQADPKMESFVFDVMKVKNEFKIRSTPNPHLSVLRGIEGIQQGYPACPAEKVAAVQKLQNAAK